MTKIRKAPTPSALFNMNVFLIWQGLQGSNLRPSVLETDTLPAELNPYDRYYIMLYNRGCL